MENVDRLTKHLGHVPLEVLLLMTPVAVLLGLSIPARWRLRVWLTMAIAWLAISRMPRLEPVASVVKAGTIFPLLMLAAAACLDGHRKPPLSKSVLAYVVTALYLVLAVATSVDWAVAVSMRLLWLAMVLAGLAVARVACSPGGFHLVIRHIAYGAMIGVGVAVAGFLFDPGVMRMDWQVRFSPWGAHSNHIGTLLIVAAVTCLLSLHSSPARRWPFIVTIATSSALACLTFSRGIIALLLVVLAPTIVRAVRMRPVLVVSAAAIVLLSVNEVISKVPQESLSRLTTASTGDLGRGWIARQYVNAGLERPLTGLLNTSGKHATVLPEVGQHAHNGYVDMFYVGGLITLVPLVIVIAASLTCAMRARRRGSFGLSQAFWADLAAALVAIYLLGFMDELLYYPTDALALIHVILAATALTAGRRRTIGVGNPMASVAEHGGRPRHAARFAHAYAQ